MEKLSNVEIVEAMKAYLDNFRKFSKEHPDEAKRISLETLRKMGLLTENEKKDS